MNTTDHHPSGGQRGGPSAPDAPAERARLYPRVTSFRSRHGTLTPAQERNWEQLWPTLGRDVPSTIPTDHGPTRATAEPLDLPTWFGRTAPTVMEVGSGTGTATAAMAAAEPDVDVLAVEVYRPGIGQLLGLIHRTGLTNVRIVRGDAVVVFTEMVATASLTGIRVFFPDPWPKSRHHKRRLLTAGILLQMADVLIDDGIVHIATDHADYAEWIAAEIAEQDILVAAAPDEVPFSLDRPTTKFEGRAEREGRVVTEFVLRRRPRDEVGAPTEPSNPDIKETP
ncbi:tRNA (guanosine(46)-N7)-methyltransferase TrmB [Williamsia sterculiae]|uniref:tRNA (guanine-N(7)-)-methyltransferase n=1 Tax=Williamsia sterculiae TaxID=1344003 RepID=A0A1N7CD51_9NOCA|nr:tRNA (guanosine(46)-N7)-methyltransferase TrmB [Williamsia sterculiae]SIR61548.1 tRNA (guanine-N7-)-methyltransferase [Williamsia sterculiae]